MISGGAVTVTSGGVSQVGSAGSQAVLVGIPGPQGLPGVDGAPGAPGAPGTSVTVQNEGVDLTQRSKFNFIGNIVTAADNPGQLRTDITIALTLGTTTQIPYMNTGGTDFIYDSEFVYNGATLTLSNTSGGVTASGSSGIIQATGSSGSLRAPGASGFVSIGPTPATSGQLRLPVSFVIRYWNGSANREVISEGVSNAGSLSFGYDGVSNNSYAQGLYGYTAPGYSPIWSGGNTGGEIARFNCDGAGWKGLQLIEADVTPSSDLVLYTRSADFLVGNGHMFRTLGCYSDGATGYLWGHYFQRQGQTSGAATVTLASFNPTDTDASSRVGVDFDDAVFTVEVFVLGRSSSGTVGASITFHKRAAFKSVGGTVSQVGATVDVSTIAGDAAVAAATCAVDVSGNAIRVRPTGVGGQTIEWGAFVRLKLFRTG